VQNYFPQSKAPYLNLLYKFIFTIPRHIICNNKIVKEAIKSYGISEEKVVPIQAFSIQYLNFNKSILPRYIEEFFNKYTNVISSYVFYRPEFFVENMIHAMKKLSEKTNDFGLIIMGSDDGAEEISKLIHDMYLENHIIIVGDQDHDNFLTIISRSKIYLRTPVKDGVCSSVLEALYLGIPVVASENHLRPESVITYQNNDINDMVEKIFYTISNHTDVTHGVVRPKISDTIVDEIEVLQNTNYCQSVTALSCNGD
jgi:glycosyltransferase involved in cell wall biosynthesis